MMSQQNRLIEGEGQQPKTPQKTKELRNEQRNEEQRSDLRNEDKNKRTTRIQYTENIPKSKSSRTENNNNTTSNDNNTAPSQTSHVSSGELITNELNELNESLNESLSTPTRTRMRTRGMHNRLSASLSHMSTNQVLAKLNRTRINTIIELTMAQGPTWNEKKEMGRIISIQGKTRTLKTHNKVISLPFEDDNNVITDIKILQESTLNVNIQLQTRTAKSMTNTQLS